MIRQLLLVVMLVVPCIANAQSLTWTRDGKHIAHVGSELEQPENRAQTIRDFFALVGSDLTERDTLICRYVADFGKDYVVTLPNCNYVGAPGQMWVHQMTIDATPTKPYSTPGFVLDKYQFFIRMNFGGKCWNVEEDGGLLGWGVPLDNTDPAHVGVSSDGNVTFIACNIDASQGMDWGIYSWASQYKRVVTMKRCNMQYCRFGVAMAGSGDPANQIIDIEDCTFAGDANGSHSYGETSNNDPNTGGALSAVLNRGGTTTIVRGHYTAVGLTEEYYKPGKWGCPRLASVCTNQYYSAAGATTWNIETPVSEITPNIAYVWNDIDIRGAGAVVNLTTKIGSDDDGTLKVYAPAP